jgi:hypothetical protein
MCIDHLLGLIQAKEMVFILALRLSHYLTSVDFLLGLINTSSPV